MKCKDCINWKPQQAELDYSTFYGICTCHAWKFDTQGVGDVRVLDRQSLSQKHMHACHFESQSNQIPFGAVEKSRYCLVTEEKFGCVNFIKR